MSETEINGIKSFMAERQEIAYKRLQGNRAYQDVFYKQDESEKIVEALYHDRFTKEERIAIRRHYEGENEKEFYEMNEVYIQGFKDCFRLIIFLGI